MVLVEISLDESHYKWPIQTMGISGLVLQLMVAHGALGQKYSMIPQDGALYETQEPQPRILSEHSTTSSSDFGPTISNV